MHNETLSVVLDAPFATVFEFLSCPENMPKWAVHFCRAIEHVDGEYYVETPKGRIMYRQQPQQAAGVLDAWGGPDEGRLAHFPSRLVDLGGGRCLYMFTMLQYPGVPDSEFVTMSASLAEELEELKRQIEQ